MDAETLFCTALAQVESESIRAWAGSDHNRPLFVRIAQRVIERVDSQAEIVDRMATVILCEAMGF